MKKNSFSNKEQWKYTNPKEFILSSNRYSPQKKSLNIKCNDNEIIIHNGFIYLVGNKLKKRGLSIHDKLNNAFNMSEIQSLKNQKQFEKCVKPYPDRDLYYNILIHDLNDIHKFITYWMEINNNNNNNQN